MEYMHTTHVLSHSMDLLLLRSLVAVADSGAITEAATRLSITQPALSRRIQQLEEHLGAALLDRGRNGVSLTEAGQLAVDEARVLTARFDRLRESIGAHVALEAGAVRVGGGATAVSFLVPPAIAALQSEHNKIRFQVKEAGSQEIERDVVQENLDLGVVTLPVASRDLDVQPLFIDQIVPVAAASHPLAGKQRIAVSDLRGSGLVGFEGGSAIRQIIDSQLRDVGVELDVVMELRSIPAILRMVATTGNLAFVSLLGVGALPGIAVLDVRGLHITRQLGVITRRGHRLSPAADAFLQRLARFAAESTS